MSTIVTHRSAGALGRLRDERSGASAMPPQIQRTPRERVPLLIIDLFRQDFSTEEIVRLRDLRASYPLAEHLSQTERERLAFLKWQIERRARGDG
jgi:hypothetical protein